MSVQTHSFELHGKGNIPEHGILIIPNRLGFDDLLHLEKILEGRRLIYLIEHGMEYNPLIHAHFDKDDVEALEFTCEEKSLEPLKGELQKCFSDDDSFVVFVPGKTRIRPGQSVAIPSHILNFLIDSGGPVLPLFVDHPEETALSTENRSDVERIVFSFGKHLPPEAANLANFTEHLLVAGEKAYGNRPVLRSHLGYQIIKGLKKHGATSWIVDGTDESELKYDKLLGAATAFSRKISKLTEKKRVGILLPPGKAGLLSNLAVIFAGKIPVNLNFTAGEKAIESCIRQADLDKFITAGPFIEKMSEFAWPEESNLVRVDEVLPPMKKVIAFWVIVSKICSADILAKILKLPREGGNKEAVLLFTSGSSGDPKGVVLSHRNVLANVNQFGSRINLRSDDTALGCLPLFHSFGCTVTLWYPMIEGVNLVTFPTPLDPGRLAELIDKYKVSLLLATPTFLRGYLRRATKEQFRSLKLVVTGAEKLPKKVADSFRKRFGKQVLEGYGLTETSPVATVNLPDIDQDDFDEDDESPLIPNEREGSVGLPIPGVAVRITDPETMDPISLHSSGMIWLKGANIFKEYLGMPDKTAEVKINSWFVTGDIGRVDEDGFLYIEGRLSRFSKIGGEMVPHETVEAAVNQALEFTDDVRKIAVVGIPDDAKGEALVLLASANVDLATLRYKLLENGIPALWVPKTIVEVDEIPILASGKLDIKGCENLALGKK